MFTGNLTTAAELISLAFVAHDLAGNAQDIASISATVERLATGSVNLSIQIQTLIAESDLVAIQWAVQGTFMALDHGAAIDAWTRHGTSFIRIADGRITEVWQGFNTVNSPAFSVAMLPHSKMAGH